MWYLQRHLLCAKLFTSSMTIPPVFYFDVVAKPTFILTQEVFFI